MNYPLSQFFGQTQPQPQQQTTTNLFNQGSAPVAAPYALSLSLEKIVKDVCRDLTAQQALYQSQITKIMTSPYSDRLTQLLGPTDKMAAAQMTAPRRQQSVSGTRHTLVFWIRAGSCSCCRTAVACRITHRLRRHSCQWVAPQLLVSIAARWRRRAMSV